MRIYIAQTKATSLMNPISPEGILKKGHKVRIPGPKKRETKSLFGSLNLQSGKFFWKSAERGNSKVFIEHLHQLRHNSKGKHVIVIVDNATLHKSRKVKDFLKRNNDVKIYYLPPYSPEYNPVEIVWKIIKTVVLGARQIENGMKEVLSRIRKLTRKWSLGVRSLNVGPGIWQKI
jgi:transposase